MRKKTTIMTKMRENFGWIKDIAIILGMVAVLWLNQNFVTNTKFESYVDNTGKKYEEIQRAIISIDKQLILLELNNKTMAVLQSRVDTISENQHVLMQQQIDDTKRNVIVDELIDKMKEVDYRIKAIEKK